MIVFNSTMALAFSYMCHSPDTEVRAIMSVTGRAPRRETQSRQLAQDRAIDLGVRALQYFGATLFPPRLNEAYLMAAYLHITVSARA
jgi:hypothetical protein